MDEILLKTRSRKLSPRSPDRLKAGLQTGRLCRTATNRSGLLLGCILVLVLALPGFGQQQGETPQSSDAVSFKKEIAPILVKKCLKCHGPEKAKGGYQLHTFEVLMKPG